MDQLAAFLDQLSPVWNWLAGLWHRLAPVWDPLVVALSNVGPWLNEVIGAMGALPPPVFVVAGVPPLLALLARSVLGLLIAVALALFGVIALLPITNPHHGWLMFFIAWVSALLVPFLALRSRRKVRALSDELEAAMRERETFRERYEREVLWRSATEQASEHPPVVATPKLAV
jgi:hypothetical protein